MKNDFVVEVNVKQSSVISLLINAFEGGSNYWMGRQSIKLNYGPYSKESFRRNGVLYPESWSHNSVALPPLYILPLHLGASIEFTEYDESADEFTKHNLDVEKIKNGLRLMQEKYPIYFSWVLTEDDDCTAADVFLQLCVFGELKYG